MISVIMPVYNGEKYLKQSIESVIQQTYKDWELIFVTDCSTDNS
ncbi:MAG: glycosyltransferase family 2 protein, partial [Eubacterium sp.]|nr:glycosyltransferase family 2 protein [Eubacterium sp.]